MGDDVLGGESPDLGGRRDARRPLRVLPTMRERQVIAYLKAGHTTKHIAFDLGISDATVRVLIMRAARRCGARTRTELLNLSRM